MNIDIQAIHAKIEKESAFVDKISTEVGKVIVGQKYMVERLLIGMLADGHILLEGVPGLAKTMTVKTLSSVISTKFQRIQFTPDLLPADIVGTMIYDQRSGQFNAKKGPIFANIVLADEINRSPAKVQSALLEAMQERQVTLGDQTFVLPAPFLVLATQNPIEQEGTYPLPEAQVDRFMLKLSVGYPERDEELEIMRRMTAVDLPKTSAMVSPEEIVRAKKVVHEVYIDPKIEKLYRGHCLCHTQTERIWFGRIGGPDRLRCIAACVYLFEHGLPGACVFASPRLCHARRRALHCHGRAASSRHRHL